MMKEFLLDWEKDTVEGAIEGLVGMGLVRDAKEFLNLLGRGEVSVDGELLAADDLGGVLYTGDVMKIGQGKFVRFIK